MSVSCEVSVGCTTYIRYTLRTKTVGKPCFINRPFVQVRYKDGVSAEYQRQGDRYSTERHIMLSVVAALTFAPYSNRSVNRLISQGGGSGPDRSSGTLWHMVDEDKIIDDDAFAAFYSQCMKCCVFTQCHNQKGKIVWTSRLSTWVRRITVNSIC